MPSSYGVKLDRKFRKLKIELPNPYAVSPTLRTVHPDVAKRQFQYEILGYYIWGTGRIILRNDLSFQVAVDTLVHEYAHYLDDDGTEKRFAHSAQWGRLYGKAYGVIHGRE